MTRILAWLMAILFTSAGITGVIVAIVEFVSAYRGFSYLENGYWWKKAISWRKTAVSLTVIVVLLALGVLSITHLLSEPAGAP